VLLKDGDMRKLRGSYHVCFMGPSAFSYWCSVCVLMSHLPSFAHLCGLGDHHIIFVYVSMHHISFVTVQVPQSGYVVYRLHQDEMLSSCLLLHNYAWLWYILEGPGI
jgi:hypothetical protein